MLGNIGAGKTTLLNFFNNENRNIRMKVLLEPIRRFRKFERHDPLTMAISKPGVNSVVAQFHIIKQLNLNFRTVLNNHTPDDILITDRSLFSPIPFTQTLCDMDIISEFAKDYLYTETLETAAKTLHENSAKYIAAVYLHSPSSLCMDRIHSRGREGENEYSTEYLEKLEVNLLKCLERWKREIGHDNVYILETKDLSSLHIEFNDILKRYID